MHKASRVTSLLCIAILLISVAQSAKAAGFTFKPTAAIVAAAHSKVPSDTASQIHRVSTKKVPTVTLTANTSFYTYGATVSVSFTISGETTSPTGQVTLKRGTETYGQTNANDASRRISLGLLPPGIHNFVLEYAGDSEYEAATSDVLAIFVHKVFPTVTLSSSATTYAVGEAVTLTASFSDTSTGTVTFTNGATNIGTEPINNGSATLSIPNLPLGTHSFTITYSGDDYHHSITTLDHLQISVKTRPTLALSLSKTNPVAGEEVTLTATLTGGNQPTGTVDIAFNGTTQALNIVAGTGSVSLTPPSSGSYTISANYTGDASNMSATATTTLNVQDYLQLTTQTLPDATIGASYSQAFTASGGSGIYSYSVYSVSSGALPAGFALEGSTGNLTATAVPATTAGTYSFTIMVTDSEERRATRTFVLKVLAQAVSAPSRTIPVPAGTSPPNVNLEENATGGPFTSADIVSATPSNAGTASIVRGEFAQAGGSTPLGWYLKYVPRTGFSGTVTVRYTLTSATGTSSVAAITYTLGYSPSAVATEVDGLARGFVESRQSMIASSLQVPGLLERRMAAEATETVTTELTPSEHGMTARFSTSLTQAKAARDAADGVSGSYASPFNLWINGQMLAHRRDENGDAWGSFGMISLGADYLLSERTLVGLSAHYDVMRDPTKEDAVLKGKGWLAGPYASLEIGKGAFWDTSLLYGGSSNEIDTEFWDGDFTTRRFMLDSAIKGQWQLEDNIVVTPKLRALYFNERASDYTVSNAAGDELTVYGFTAEQLRISLGVEIERSFLLTNGATFKPKLGLTGGLAGIEGSGVFGAVSLGATLRTSDFWMLDAAILYNLEGHGQRSIGARLGASKQF